MADRVLLKKYSNRRLYNTEKSTYVTLAETAEIIREGREVRIVDAKTEEDVTAFILTQVIVEEARKKHSVLPVSLLHLFIQFGEDVLGEFFEKYLELSIRNYLSLRKSFDDQFTKWLEMGADFSDPRKNMTPFPSMKPFMDFFPNAAKSNAEEE